MTGKIIKGIAGFYYVYAEGNVYECKAKGIFRNKSIKPLVGDNVKIDVVDEADEEGHITEIFARDNELVRPAVANVDQAMIVFALKSPDPNFNLLDKFLVMMEFQNIETVICFNKTDIADEAFIAHVKDIYNRAGYKVIFTSATENEGVGEVMNTLRGKTTVFAGPSGVGKSSMLNALTDDEMMEIGEVSRKIGRGKHTTRHSEIFRIEEDTYVFDTPGFSSLYIPGMTKEKLEDYFPEFFEYTRECRFIGCAHIDEPDCAVKKAVEDGAIALSRYENYKLFYKEIKKKENQYG